MPKQLVEGSLHWLKVPGGQSHSDHKQALWVLVEAEKSHLETQS